MGKCEIAEQCTESNGDNSGNSEQFDRFEQLTRRLLTVPEQETDKEQAKKTRKKAH